MYNPRDTNSFSYDSYYAGPDSAGIVGYYQLVGRYFDIRVMSTSRSARSWSASFEVVGVHTCSTESEPQ